MFGWSNTPNKPKPARSPADLITRKRRTREKRTDAPASAAVTARTPLGKMFGWGSSVRAAESVTQKRAQVKKPPFHRLVRWQG